MARTDVAIVGAGFAGLACALQLGGRDVVIHERHDSVVNKQRGCLSLGLGSAFEARDGDLFLPGIDLLVEGGIRDNIHRLELVGRRERLTIQLRTPWKVIDERRLKGALLRKVREAGVEIRLGSAVREVTSDGREAHVRAQEEDSCRVLVGADGGAGLVGNRFLARREKQAVLFQRETEVDSLDLAPGTLHVQIDGAHTLFFAVPHGDRVLASVLHVVDPHGVPIDLNAVLSEKVERLGGGRWRVARSAVVRAVPPAASAFRENVVLAGDAVAAYGFATIGGALTMGVLAGQAVRRTLAGSRYALPDYDKRWRRALRQDLAARLGWLGPLLGRIEPARIDRALHALRGARQSLWPRFPLAMLRLFL